MSAAEVESEVSGLNIIKMRWTAPHSYMRPSFLEQPYKTYGGILGAIEWLQSSALDWGPVNYRDEGYTWEMNHLHSVAESALSYFDEFRTVFRHESLPLLQAQGADTSSYDGFGRIPARIHKDATRAVWHIHTSSLFDLHEFPSVDRLRGAGVWVGYPLRDRHLAVIAALACCFRSINRLHEILEFWRGLFRSYRLRGSAPLHFDGDYGSPAWEEELMRQREEPSNLLWETERRHEAFSWIERAGAWLAYADEIERTNERIDAAKQRGSDEARQLESKRRSQAGKKGAKSKQVLKAENQAKVKAAWDSLQSNQRASGGVAAIVAKKAGVNRRTALRHLQALGYRPK